MKFMKKAALIGLVCGAVGFTGACSSDDDSSSSAETINVAPSGPLDISESRITPGSFYMEVAAKKADGSGLEYQELAEPIGRVTRVWDEVE